MGEVYRADDLKLGQTVALKFLPDDLMHDPARLAQFHNEVRVARTISHRNVCRTYDIGDADGQPFLTMEYVDGEDLSSLLRRIGRFPQEKAIEVARQICAGVAAAHERGVLHRDLKPANVMIDGDGHVRLTDFGLAAIAGSVDNVRAGTPAYMAPEQLAGREVTPRSDIYALGLVLFELFTGKRVFEAATLNELMQLHESGTVATPSSLVARSGSDDRAGDPALPRARAGEAARVGARGVGGAARRRSAGRGAGRGRNAVAGDGRRGRRAERAAAGRSASALVAFTLVMLALLMLASQRFAIIHHIPLPKSNDSLHDRAQEILEQFGYRDAPYDTARAGCSLRLSAVDAAANNAVQDLRRALATGRTGTVIFWYRTSPGRPGRRRSTTSCRPSADPPFVFSDMRMVCLDPHGRLLEFQALPPQVEEGQPSTAAPDWQPLFDAAGLTRSPRFTRSNRDGAARPLRRPYGVGRAAAGHGGCDPAGRGGGVSRPPIFFNALPPWTGPRGSSAARRRVDRVGAGHARQRHRRADCYDRRRVSRPPTSADRPRRSRRRVPDGDRHLRHPDRGACARRAALRDRSTIEGGARRPS